jgi:mutual gliding-motility protein MglA
MAEFDQVKRQLTYKLLYYGPALSGKTTNLIRLHQLLAPQQQRELTTLETYNERTLFFDLMTIGFAGSSGLKLRIKVFGVAGHVTLDGTRNAVLSRADALVFVADSGRSQAANNDQSFASLTQHVRKAACEFDALPVVVQCNKRDLPDVFTQEELRARWQSAGRPLSFASALTGEGVLQTFRTVLELLYRKTEPQFRVFADDGLSEQSFIAAAMGG